MFRVLCVVGALSVAHRAAAGPIVNGDFEAGNTGFTSGYAYVPAGNSTEGQYTVRNSPSGWNSAFFNIANHTTGTATGLYMVVNGATTGGITIWQETVAVNPNTAYTFTGYVSTAVDSRSPNTPPVIEAFFNGTSGGPSFTAPATVGSWALMSWGWNSGAATSLTIRLQNANTAVFPNDFYLDDFALNGPASTAVPEPATLAVVGLFGLGAVALRRRRANVA